MEGETRVLQKMREVVMILMGRVESDVKCVEFNFLSLSLIVVYHHHLIRKLLSQRHISFC